MTLALAIFALVFVVLAVGFAKVWSEDRKDAAAERKAKERIARTLEGP